MWMVRPLGFQIDDRQLRRAGLDYWQYLDWEVIDNFDALTKRLPLERMWFFSKKAEKSYADVTFAPDDALVFGSESQGLPDSMLRANADRCLRIPIHPNARCLNLAVSVAVVAFEVKRQSV